MSKEKTQAQSTICSNCGGQLEINSLQETVECPFCGTSYVVADLLDESDAVRIEKIKSQIYKEVEADKIKREIEKEKSQEEKDSVAVFKKSKFSKVLIGFAIFGLLCIMTGFRDGRIMAGLTAVVMTALFIGSWLMGMKIIKEPKKGVRILSAIIAFVLIIPYFSFYNASSDRTEKFAWSDMELYEVLPEPSSNVGEIVSNSETSLSIYVHKVSKAQYKEYLKECEDMGYTIDADKSEMNYSAYNQDGYKLSLWYNESDEELHIGLDAPLEMSEIQWPASNIVSKLPVPKSQVGEINYEHDTSFAVYVGDTTKSDYDEYVNSCINNGFNIDYSKNEKTYWGDDAEGYHVSIEYKGNNTMYISIDAPDEDEPEEDIEEDADVEDEEESETGSSNGISADFKAAMDSYEKFFDEYVAIMKKYENNPNDMSILADYSKYMGKYAQMMEDFEKWEDEDMNAAETAYYVQVQGRITKKLLEVGQ